MEKLLTKYAVLSLFSLLVVTVLLRLPLLNSSFWLDEAAQALESARPFSQQLQIRDDFQPPLIHLLVHGLLYISTQEWWLRVGAALIPGVITVATVVLIGQKLYSRSVGFLAGVLLATSSFHIFYSQELRPYSLPTMFAALGWLTVFYLTSKKTSGQRQRLLFAAWIGCSALGLYSSYLYPFALLGQLFYFFASWRRNKEALLSLIVSVSCIAILFAPWLPSFLDQLQAGQQLRTSFPGWESIVSFTQVKSLALVGGKFLFGVLDLGKSPFFLIATLLIGLSSVYLVTSLRQDKQFRQVIWTILCWAIVPIGLAWLISFWVPVIQPKRVLFALPAMYVFVSWLVITAAQQKKQLIIRSGCLLAAVLLGVNLFSTYSYFTQPKYQREDWRGMHQYIVEKYGKGQGVAVFSFPSPFAGWEWYNRETNFSTIATGVFVLSKDPSDPSRVRLKRSADYHFVLVFDYLRDLSDPERLIEQDLERFGYKEVDRITPTTPLGVVKVYARTGQIIGFSE